MHNIILISLARESGVAWWCGLVAWGLLLCEWHAKDIDLGRGCFVPVCEFVSLGVGCVLGGGNRWRMCAFGALAFAFAPFGHGRNGKGRGGTSESLVNRVNASELLGHGPGRPRSEGPSPGRVRRRVGFFEEPGSIGANGRGINFVSGGEMHNGLNFSANQGVDTGGG
eukprot:520514-Karenia_brevis.AAC.1